MKFRTKIVEIEAVQLTWGTWSEVCDLAARSTGGDKLKDMLPDEARAQYPDAEVNREWIYAVIPTDEGPMLARQGDWIVRGLRGELYPCKPDVFEMKYEQVEAA